MSTQAQITANQSNAQLSMGPTSAEGKAKSSRNALKTGLTGHTVLLPGDDAELYETKLLRCVESLSPVGEKETALVQALADTEWRLARIPGLEYGIYALARIEFADKFNDQPAELHPGFIQAHTYLAYHRQLNNLSIQESRLNRQLVKITNDLASRKRQRQQQEKQDEQAKLTEAARHYIAANKAKKPFNHKEFGFDFSMDQIDRYAKLLQEREKGFPAA
jgi:hypothetical protein